MCCLSVSRLGSSAGRLPAQLATSFVKAAQDVQIKVAIAPRDQLGLAAAAAIGLLLGAFLVRHLLHSRLIAGQPDSALATPAAAVRDSILTLVPAAVWWAAAYVLGLSRETMLLICGVLAIWPVVAIGARVRASVIALAMRRAWRSSPYS